MPVTVAACQTAAHLDRPTFDGVEAAVRTAAAAGAQLVVLPEQCVSGCCFTSAAEAREAAEPSDGPTIRRLQALSAKLGVVLVAGYAELVEDGRLHNSAVLIESGRVLHHYRKVHLWGREKEWFTPGTQPPIPVDTQVGRVAVMICYDLELPEWVRLAALTGADLIAAPCNWPLLDRPPTERALEVIKAQASAGINKVPIVIADRCGRERGTDWIGGSVIVDSTGYLLAGPATAHGETAQPVVLTAQLDIDRARDKTLGPWNHVLADRRPELYTDLTAR